MTDPLVAALRQRREQLGWTRQRLATAAGMSYEQLAHYERGGRTPNVLALQRLASALGCDLVLTPKPDVRVSLPGGIWPSHQGVPNSPPRPVAP